MKAFTLEFAPQGHSTDIYLKDRHSPIGLSEYGGVYVERTDDIDDSKNWRTKSIATRYLKMSKAKAVKVLDEAECRLVGITQQNYSYRRRIGMVSDIKLIQLKLETAKVIEIDIDRPNFADSTKPKYRYQDYYKRHGGMRIEKYTTSKHTCECCGVILKNIPCFVVGAREVKVCIPCMKLRQEAIDKAFDRMDDEHRTELTNNYIINQI